MTIYRLEQGPDLLADLFRQLTPAPIEKDFVYAGSGKAALAIVLAFLKQKGALPNKMTPILMPPWIGTWVYAEVLPYSFPTIDPSAPSPVALCYHQYGFPQDMDKVLDIAQARNISIIEDCAHAAGSLYKGRPLGEFGQFAIYSFSKFAFCFALGAAWSRDPEFANFARQQINKGSAVLRLLINSFKLMDEWHSGLDNSPAASLFNGVRKMAYARYGDQPLPGRRAINLWTTKRAAELQARRDNYHLLREVTDHLGICDHLEETGVAPYAVPIAVAAADIAKTVVALNEVGIRAGVYQFDFNRCLFSPDYRPCILLPVHGSMSGKGMDITIRCLKNTL